MLAFTARTWLRQKAEARKRSDGPRPTSAERRLGLGLSDRRPKVKKSLDVFRSDDRAEREMMNPPRSAFSAFFKRWIIPARREPTVEARRMDPSWPSASGARLSLTTLLV